MERNISNIFDFFDAKESNHKNDNEESFKTMSKTRKDIYEGLSINPDNGFLNALVLVNFMENISTMTISVTDLFENPCLSKIDAFYKDAKNEIYEYHYEELDKLQNIIQQVSPALTRDFVEKTSSYIAVEALSEMENSTITRLNKTNPDKHTSFHLVEDFSNFDSDIEAIEYVSNKPYGLYFVNTKTEYSLSNSSAGKEPLLISHQGYGMDLIRLKSRRQNRIASKTIIGLHFDNMISKSHNIDFLFTEESDSKELTQHISVNNAYKNIINQLITKVFVQFYVKQVQDGVDFKKAQITLHRESNESGNTLPIIAEYAHQESKPYTFDDLRFKGKYEFLSILDEAFKDVLRMDIVNHSTTNRKQVAVIRNANRDQQERGLTLNIGTEKPMPKRKHAFSKSSGVELSIYNDFDVRLYDLNELPTDVSFWNSTIHSVPESTVGLFENNESTRRKVAMANKLTLLDYYLPIYAEKWAETLNEELKELVMVHYDEMLNDPVLMKMANIGMFPCNKANEHSMFPTRIESFCANEAVGRKIDFDALQEVSGKNKAAYSIVIQFLQGGVLDYLKEKYDFKPSKESERIIKIEEAGYRLKEIYKEEGHTVYSSLYSLFNFDMDIELYGWFNNFSGTLTTVIPVKNSRKKKFEDFAKLHDILIKKPSYSGQRVL